MTPSITAWPPYATGAVPFLELLIDRTSQAPLSAPRSAIRPRESQAGRIADRCARERVPLLLLRCLGRSGSRTLLPRGHAVALEELFHAPFRIHDLLLACIEGVTRRADFRADLFQ